MSTSEPKLLLTVFGATGQQGGSIIRTVLSTPSLASKYRLRGLTRDPSSAAAQKLHSQGVEIKTIDVNADSTTIASALHGSSVVFALTVTDYTTDTYSTELRQGKAIADAAMSAGVPYLIFSTLPHVKAISGGKYTLVGGFDGKAETETYIRGLSSAGRIKSAFFAPGCFMQNFQHMMAPRSQDGGKTYAIAGVMDPQTRMPLIDTAGDTGKYVGAILADLDAYEGKVLSAATEWLSMSEIAEKVGRAIGKNVAYQQLPVEVYKSFLPENARHQLVEMYLYIQDYGYFGPEGKEGVEWTVRNVQESGSGAGQLTTFDSFLVDNPVHIE
ncbi:hypothetical protein LTR84_008542 [Exophiala bonariae]|uniref:NmrA-like domain-containing protein n=1 Tax=Exophiala bonariae TaxID=1690606 RepID=A0AAV9N0B2_9EURO|nr:hypothetical protein LTR84_008542 [Exophiala bonariae]